MRFYAFTGIRYASGDVAGGHVAPPYDQIDEALRARLHRDRHHFSRLIRPVAEQGDAHSAAAALHHRWMEQDLLGRESEPSIYPYEIRLVDGERRLGICGLVGLEDPTSTTIRPHEATVEKTVNERLSLLRTTELDLEPILLLAEDDGSLSQLLEADLEGRQPLVNHQDLHGNSHRLFRVESPSRIATYQQALGNCDGLIADGHHRYTVAQRYAQEIGAAEGSAAACKLAVITSLSSPGLRIDPIHRLLRLPVSMEQAVSEVVDRQRIAGDSGDQITMLVASAPQPSLAVASRVDQVEIWRFDPGQAPEDLPSYLRHLAVGWLHGVLLPELGLTAAAATDGTVVYRSDPNRLYSEVAAGEPTLGFWLPGMSSDDFAGAMSGGHLLPPKSTRFLPKLASGLVWASHDTQML
jgi:uncharacterized protein (DUF1015 family)